MPFASTRNALFLILFISVAILIFAFVWRDLNTSFFLGLLFNDAQEFARNGVITSNFMPIGYSGFLGSCIKAGGVGLIPACQAFIYMGALIGAFCFFVWRGVRGGLLFLGILAIALYPTLVLNVWRIHDGNLTVLLLLGFLAAGIAYLRFKNIWGVLALGIFAGLLFTVRQNTALLFLAALFLLFGGGYGERIGYFIKRAIIFSLSALIFMTLVNFAVRGTPFFFGNQGPYNFFSGANEYTSKYLLKDFSGENSLREALRARGFSSAAQTFEERLSFPGKTYTQLAVRYIKSNPLEYIKLTALKVVTLLRPGYHLSEGFVWISTEGLKRVSKIILSFPVFIWFVFVYRTRKSFFEKENLFVFLVVVLYAVPFLVANSDPRYRFPLDIIFITDSFGRWNVLRTRT